MLISFFARVQYGNLCWLHLFRVKRDERVGNAVDISCQTLGRVHALCPRLG